MSGEGPESIPTSADPRSRRPAKKRALDPKASQAAHLDALFARPDQEIRLPPSASGALQKPRSAPPEIVANVQGSSAGAGSGEFHVYKAARRREYERLRDMDAQVRREREGREFESGREERERRDAERTRKNREKRDKMKARKANKGKPTGSARPGAAPAQLNGSSKEDDEEEDRDGQQDSRDRHMDNAPARAAQPIGLVIHDDDD